MHDQNTTPRVPQDLPLVAALLPTAALLAAAAPLGAATPASSATMAPATVVPAVKTVADTASVPFSSCPGATVLFVR